MSIPKAVISALAGEVKLPSASAILGELGTVLLSVLATLANTHALVLPPDVVIALSVVAGVLVATHVVSAKWAETVLAKIEADLHVTAAQAKQAQQAEAAAKMAEGMLHSLGAVAPPR